jgi:hypothetical protein
MLSNSEVAIPGSLMNNAVDGMEGNALVEKNLPHFVACGQSCFG